MREYVVLDAEGQHEDDVVERGIFADLPEGVSVRFLRGTLSPGASPIVHPLSSLPKELREQVDGLILLKSFMTAEDVELFPRLKVVVRSGVGYDRVDRVALAKKGILISNIPDYGTADIADHALALALSMRRGVLLHHDRQRSSPPADWAFVETPLVSRIFGATFGVMGMGRIGTATVLRAKAFGWRVIFYDPYLPNGADKSLGVERVKTIEELFTRSQTLSIHAPHTTQTRKLVGSRLINLMPPGAILVNTARGEIVDLDGVEEGLRTGKLAGAALDVLPVEPIPDDCHSLIRAYRDKESWLEGRLVLTPHVAYYAPESLDEIRSKSSITMREVLIEGLKTNVIPVTSE